MKNVRIRPCGNVKQIKKSPNFLRNHYNIYFLYKMTGISYKSCELVIRLFLWTLCMIEYVQTRVWVNNITMFNIINSHWECGDLISPWNGVHTADTLSMLDLNVPNKPTSSEWNSAIVFLNLRTSNLRRHERYGYFLKSDTDTTSLTCPGAAMVGIFNAA